MGLQRSVEFDPESTLFPSVCSVPSIAFFHSNKLMYNCCSKFTQGHSKTRAKQLQFHCKSMSLPHSLFSHGKIKRYGEDLQLLFRLAIVERISRKPAPEILYHPLTQSLSYNWVNESHYSWEALCFYLWTNFQHLCACSRNWALS